MHNLCLLLPEPNFAQQVSKSYSEDFPNCGVSVSEGNKTGDLRSLEGIVTKDPACNLYNVLGRHSLVEQRGESRLEYSEKEESLMAKALLSSL